MAILRRISSALSIRRGPKAREIDGAGKGSSHISMLTEDVLENIFLQCLLCNTEITVCARVFPMQTIIRVCRLWHDVAMDSGRLWSTVCLTYPKLALKYLARSRLASLHVSWVHEPNLDVNAKVLRQVQCHASRIQLIDVEVSCPHLALFLEMIGRELPCLEVCTIKGAHIVTAQVPILFNAPRLRSLAIAYINIGSCNLKHVLKETRTLETLVIRSTVLLDTNNFVLSPPINLPHLRTCRLSDVAGAQLFLNFTRFPSTVHLEWNGYHSIMDRSKSFTKLTPTTITHLQSCFRHAALSVGRTQIRTTPIPHDMSQGAFTIGGVETVLIDRDAAMNISRRVVDWSSIVHLEINGDGTFTLPMDASMAPNDHTVSAWTNLFRALPELTTVVVGRAMPIGALMRALCAFDTFTATRSWSAQGLSRLVCPLLHTLSMIGFNLDREYTYRPPLGIITKVEESTRLYDVQSLYWLLEVRNYFGAPLEEMHFKGCCLHATTEDLLKGVTTGLKIVVE